MGTSYFEVEHQLVQTTVPRAACRGRSKAEFRAKLGIVEEEGDESIYWMELLIDSGIMTFGQLKDLMQEANEIVAVVVASINTSRRS